jgi:hypothetical protein
MTIIAHIVVIHRRRESFRVSNESTINTIGTEHEIQGMAVDQSETKAHFWYSISSARGGT